MVWYAAPSRTATRKYLRSDDKEPSYGKRESRSRLDPFVEKLARWLKPDSGKNRKQRNTFKQGQALLRALARGARTGTRP